ncbi:hypothetical protein C8R43DRAFT_74001 [Mycena crocata]|nr:hypothetical protein C8R43DRAFT_74001 [Mycena crocata]
MNPPTHQMSSSQDPGHPAYRRNLGTGNLLLRWSTVADRVGCILLSCLAVQDSEGKETEWAVRFFKPYTDDAFHWGSSTNWALCVDTSPTEASPVGSDAPESDADKVRAEAATAQERVVAVVYLLQGTVSFDQGAVTIPVGKAQIVACKPAYRQSGGGGNIMKYLFEMVTARAQSLGCPLMMVSGIPQYYRTQNYEFAINLGRGLLTHLSTLRPASTESSPLSLRPARLDDLPDLERMANAPRATAELFTADSDASMLKIHLRWMLGDRPSDYPTPAFPVHPFFVLEKRDIADGPPRIVAGAGLYNYSASQPTAVAHALLWDGVEDASAVAVAVARGLVAVLEAKAAAETPASKPTTIRWILPDAHPLYRWLLAHELAVPVPETSRYDQTSLWVAVPSLPRFLTALIPALNARLLRAAPILGANYTGTLHIGASRTYGGGAVLRVVDGSVFVEPAVSGQGTKPNLSLPRSTLVQLMMGYAGWRELKATTPDVGVEPAVVPLVDVLFPKRSVGTALYL